MIHYAYDRLSHFPARIPKYAAITGIAIIIDNVIRIILMT